MYRLSRGRVLGRVGGQPVLLLQNRAAQRPAAHDAGPPAWLLNLRADPRARIQVRSAAIDVIAREAPETEYANLWPRLTAASPALDKVAQRAGRRLPILVLRPRADAEARDA